MILAWLTDPHFDHIRNERDVWALEDRIRTADVGAIVITGDVAEALTFAGYVTALGTMARRVVYYVLGNHDFYGGSIAETRREASKAGAWLGACAPVDLGNGACLLGVDGWYDFRAGRGADTRIAMNDWHHIHDFASLNRSAIVAASRALAEQSAELATRKLQAAVQAGYTRILLATHVPPFAEASRHDGKPSDPDWAAVMVNQVLGDTLFAFATEHPEVSVEVLCGHTHEAWDGRLAENLRVRVGRADYGRAFFEVVG